MSNTLESLRQVVGARPGRSQNLLQTSRFEGFGCEIAGGQNIGDVFKGTPFVVAPEPHYIAQESTLAVLDADEQGNPVCFFADTYQHRIGRLWRVGPAPASPLNASRVISVPFDPRLSQLASNVAFRAADHVDLDAAAATHVVSVVDELCTDQLESGAGNTVRRTAFVIRAVSRDSKCAVLVQLHELTTEPKRSSCFRLAAVFFRFAGARIVHSVQCVDGSAGGEWTPHIQSPEPAITDDAPGS